MAKQQRAGLSRDFRFVATQPGGACAGRCSTVRRCRVRTWVTGTRQVPGRPSAQQQGSGKCRRGHWAREGPPHGRKTAYSGPEKLHADITENAMLFILGMSKSIPAPQANI